MTPRIGVISNAHSKRNRIAMRDFRAILAAHPQVLHRGLDDIAEMPDSLRFMAASGVTHLVISGGDGTVLAGLSHLLNDRPFPVLPKLSLLSAGMTNVVAHEVGLPGFPAAGLTRLVARVEAGDPGEALRRPVLSIDLGAGRPLAHGFLMGAIGFYQGTMLTRKDIHRLGAKYSFAAKLGIFWSAAKLLLCGPGAISGFHGESVDLDLDGQRERRDCLLVMATSLDSLLPRISPFWGEGEGAIRFTTIADPPRRFAQALLPLLRGRPKTWMAESGYRSQRLRRLELRLKSPIVIDGEVFAPPPDGLIRIASGPQLTFHRY